MKLKWQVVCLLVLAVVIILGIRRHAAARNAARQRVVRCAVIGGMTMSGMWPEISRMFEAKTGYHVEVVVTGERPLLDRAIRAGKVDLLTMHSGDITTDIIADGIGVNMRPWTRNELVIVGPPDDPAGVRGMTNGALALKKIAAAQANFVDFLGVGSREMTHTLWRLAGIEPKGDWVIKDDTGISKWNVLQFCRSNHAYVVVGYLPALTGKMPNQGVEILVKGDPVMRRPYIVMEANPAVFPQVNYAGARALSDFLLSPQVQNFLLEFGRGTPADRPFFFPVNIAPHPDTPKNE
jgi:tungstate transport system substrate-binding protein